MKLLQSLPLRVKQGILLLYSSLGVGLVMAGLQYSYTEHPNRFILAMTISFATQAFLIFMISLRKKWALFLTTIFLIVGLYSTFSRSFPSLGSFSKYLALIDWLAQLIGIVLLFSTPARIWFSQNPPKT